MKKYLLLLLVAASSLTQAATFNVSTTPELRIALSTAATNGEDDTINLADGTYKTTDDGEGTFIYLSNESNSLIIQGSSADNAILSGNYQTGIINFKSTQTVAKINLTNISFLNGKNIEGGGIYSTLHLNIKGSAFAVNSSEIGSAIYGKNLTIQSTQFIKNSFNGIPVPGERLGGSTVYSANTYIDDSTFDSNNTQNVVSANNSGPDDSLRNIKVTNSNFNNNGDTSDSSPILFNPSWGLYGSSSILSTNWGITVNNSIFINNNIKKSIRSGNAYYNQKSSIKNSIFVNSGTAVLLSKKNTIENSLFNNSNLYLSYIDNNIYNTIILSSSINGSRVSGEPIINIENSYLDLNDVAITVVTESIIFNNVTLGFVSEINDNYNLTGVSDLIDVGTAVIDDIDLLITDLNGNDRISGGNIDIGPYEFSSTKPTINFVTYTGTAKEQSELTFTTDYTLADGRGVIDVSYDYLNDENYTSLNTYTYNTAGTYTVNVKVTDSEGEFSTSSLGVAISELPWNEMTYEQRLIKAVSPEYYELLISEIDIEKSKSFSSGKHYVQNNLTEFSLVTEAAQAIAVAASNTSGITTGKQYVQNNLAEFSLVTEAAQATAVAAVAAAAATTGITDGENNVINNPVTYGLNIVVGLSKEGLAQLPSGWKMISIPEDVTDLGIFNDAKIVWFFNNETQAWTGYSSNTNTAQQLEDKNIGIITSLSAGDGVFIEM
ncbi:hypothetical protein H4J46_05475 [Colwellia sp. MB02u-6]|uniref:hypothetical protein n=1 Tax=Colwellia sp. MB02u-6 TaxID=2759824 RepID=UPI0015F58032|nr:hypothetical protein [Colwellia sp. MB02u-6]MBA6327393.1 hypothetical protein [Colwellia sp. MB02u-6]